MGLMKEIETETKTFKSRKKQSLMEQIEKETQYKRSPIISSYSPAKAAIQKGQREFFRYGGLTAGGILPELVAGPAGLGIAPLTAGAGYELGDRVADFVDDLFGLSQVPIELRPPKLTPSQEVSKSVKMIAEGAAIETLGRLSAPVMQRGIEKGLGSLIPIIDKLPRLNTLLKPRENAQQLYAIYKKYGIEPLPSELIPQESKTLSIIESVMGYSPGAADIMLKKSMQKVEQLVYAANKIKTMGGEKSEKEFVGRLVKNELRDIMGRYTNKKGAELEAIVSQIENRFNVQGAYVSGKNIQELFESRLDTLQAGVRNAYQEVTDLLGGNAYQRISLSDDIMNWAKGQYQMEISKTPKMQDRKIVNILKDFMPQKTDREIISPSYSWQGLDKTRSALLEKVRDIRRQTGGLDTNESRIYSELAEKIDSELERIASGFDKTIYSKYILAKSKSRELHELFNKDILSIMKMSPEDVAAKIVNNGEITLLSQVRDILGEEGVENLRSAYIKKTLQQSVNSKTGVFDPKRFENLLSKTGDETLAQFLTPQHRDFINNLLKEAKYINSRTDRMKTWEFMDTIIGVSNEKVVDAIFKPDNRGRIRLVRRLLSSERVEEIQQLALEKIFKTVPWFSRKTGKVEDLILPVQAAREIKKYETTLMELLPPQVYRDVHEFFKIGLNMKRVEQLAQNLSQTGQVFVGWSTLQAIMSSPVATVTTLGIPWMMAKIYTSDMARKYFLMSVKLPPDSTKAIELFGKAIATAYKTEEDMEAQAKWGHIIKNKPVVAPSKIPPEYPVYKSDQAKPDPLGIR